MEKTGGAKCFAVKAQIGIESVSAIFTGIGYI
jgi:hypothetical protein